MDLNWLSLNRCKQSHQIFTPFNLTFRLQCQAKRVISEPFKNEIFLIFRWNLCLK